MSRIKDKLVKNYTDGDKTKLMNNIISKLEKGKDINVHLNRDGTLKIQSYSPETLQI